MASPPRKRAKIVMDIAEKGVILDRLHAGEKVCDVARSYQINESTIRSIKKNERKIRDSIAASCPSTAKSVFRVRVSPLEKTEKALSIWIEDMRQKNFPLSSRLIRHKAKKIFEMYKDPEVNFDFQASKGWFENLKKRIDLHSIKLVGESASADHVAARKFPQEFLKVIEDGGYAPEQVFNADETGLFWKKMPSRTFISKAEASAPGFKASKERLSILFCANAVGDCKLKPMVIHKFENPRALPKDKRSLPVIWRANKKGWVSSMLFKDWFQNYFVESVRKYLESKNLAFKVLLVIDNAPVHPPTLAADHPNVKVLFLPPNTTSLIQPLDQGIIAAFKAYYTIRCMDRLEKDMKVEGTIIDCWKKFTIADCVDYVDESWTELCKASINACWRKLWPQIVQKGNNPPSACISEQHELIVQLAHKIGGDGFEDMQIKEVEELLESHEEELTEEELLDVIEESCDGYEDEQNQQDSPEVNEKNFGLKNIQSILDLGQQLVDFVLENDPSFMRSIHFKRQMEAAIKPYEEEYRQRVSHIKQPTIMTFFERK